MRGTVRSGHLGGALEKKCQIETQTISSQCGQPSLSKTLIEKFGLRYMLTGFLLFIEETTTIVQPVVLSGLVQYFSHDSVMTKTESYMYAAGVSFCAVVLVITHHSYYFAVQMIGVQIRTACSALIYRKSLQLSQEGCGKTTTGQIINLMTNDVKSFDQVVTMLHYVWVGPCSLLAIAALLWYELGPAALSGFGMMFLITPLLWQMGKLISKFRLRSSKHKDERMHLMKELVSGMRVIKMFCWEKSFEGLVTTVRRKELNEQRKLFNVQVIHETLSFVPKALFLLPVLVVMALLSNDIRVTSIFVAVRLYDYAGSTVLRRITLAYTYIVQTRISIKRIETFLRLEEFEINKEGDTSDTKKDDIEHGIVMEKASAKWKQSLKYNTLHDITVKLEIGKCLTVIGPVGAGKSSLLMAVLKELHPQEGRIEVKGRLAYVSQQPWVFSETLRQNILFGNKYDQEKFDRILKACALEKDIAKLPHGDMTLLGDRGVKLSGGQKARVTLARSLYMDADIYLLDDPLSSVDSYVGRHIFENVVQGVLKDKTRILVTHQEHFIKKTDQILFLKQGKVFFQGSYGEYRTLGVDTSSLQTNYQDKGQIFDCVQTYLDKEETVNNNSLSPDDLKSSQEESTSTTSTSTHSSSWSLTSIGDKYVPEEIQVPEKEKTNKGKIGVKVYYKDFTAGAGNLRLFVLFLLFLATQGAFVLSDWWLALWSSKVAIAKDNQNSTKINTQDVDTTFNILVYTGIVVGFLLICLLQNWLFYKIAVDITDNLHNRMLSRVIMSPIRFFDRNEASGQILNRFSNDIRHLDDLLPKALLDAIRCALLVLSMVIVAGIVSPWVYTAVIPLLLVFVKIRMGYISKANSIRRLMATTQSPIQSHILATAEGISSVRAFSAKDRMVEKYDNLHDLHVEANISFLKTARWFAAKLDVLCAIFVTVVCVSCLFLSEDVDAGTVGLSLTYAISLSSIFQWCVRRSAEVENKMVSVERVIEYTELPSEGPYEKNEDSVLAPDWPQKCEISVTNASLRYSDDTPLILKNLTFTIRAKDKVGIVGRTGAGKSSLINMLFRLVEPEGKITIDGVDIQKIGLSILRKNISIIPQEPVLFTGTLRQNLDPFGCFEDKDLWKALEEVQLKEMVKGLPQCLNAIVTEGGNNFSVGQRQLLCLARAILRNNEILIIDEATANVDPRTDTLIQKTVRIKFSHCTVLTIAHRLHTVMDSDKVLVLDDGIIKEYDAPYILLQKPGGYLRKLVEQTGPLSTLYLKKIAREDRQKLHDNLVGHSIQKTPNDVTKNGSLQTAHVLEGENDKDVDDESYVGTYL